MLDPVARTRRRSPDEEFFVEGNHYRFENYKKRGADAGFSPEVCLVAAGQQFVCTEVGCGQPFRSLIKYEEHRFRCHSHVCSVCGKSFPSDRLLSFHISELHDNYFAALSKRKPSYNCLVVGCDEVFWSNGDRRLHLIAQHKYHPSYDFHNPRRYMQTYKKKSAHDTHLRSGSKMKVDSSCTDVGKQSEPDKNTMEVSSNSSQLQSTANEGMQVEDASCSSKSAGNRAQRRAQKKLKFDAQQHIRSPSSSAVSYVGAPVVAAAGMDSKSRMDSNGLLVSTLSDGEARPESKGQKVHSAESTPLCGHAVGPAGDAMVVEDDGMDSLVQGMRQVSVKVPSTISFGRRKRHGHS